MEQDKEPMAEKDHSTRTREGLDRRTLVKGAAWSVPVVLAAVSAPLAAASVLVTYTKTWTAVGTDPTTCTFQLPAGATNIRYVVRGGGGGMGNLSAGAGKGALLSGTFSDVSVATTVAVVAGGGGRWGGGNNPGSTRAPGIGTGGKGFGNGGDAPLPPAASGSDLLAVGAGGGAGSAILIGGAVAVVAGGGGGGGSVGSGYVVGQVSPPNSDPIGGTGDAQSAGTDQQWQVKALDGTTILRTLLGHGGTGGSASAAGIGGGGTFSGTGYTTLPLGALGGNGGAPSGGTGGAGGAGVVSDLTSTLSGGPVRVATSSGGGGGGYYGGGGGGAIKGAKNGSDRGISTGGGGGGGSYTAATAGGVSIVPGSSGLGPVGYPDGIPGLVTITFDAAAGFTWPC